MFVPTECIISTQKIVAFSRDSQFDELEDNQESTVIEHNTKLIKLFLI